MTPKARLLVVDDEDAVREALARRLRTHGYEVIAARDGAEALALLARTEVDVVLLDRHMPGLGGLEVLDALRRRFTATELPVIIVTASMLSEHIVEGLERGANDYVGKHADVTELVARIEVQRARRTAATALGEREARYALALRGANDGLWDWRIAAGVHYSARWKAIVGLAPEDPAGEIDDWLDRVHPDDLPRVRRELDEHLGGCTPRFECEHRLRHASGRYMRVVVRGLAARGADGRALRMAGSLSDVTETRTADPLTGLANRALLEERLGQALEGVRLVPADGFALLFLDLDRFAHVNASLGPGGGDRLLIEVARRLQGATRASEAIGGPGPRQPDTAGATVARLGGNEFAVMLHGVGESRAPAVAERLLRAFAAPFSVDGREVGITASGGLAIGHGGYQRPEDVLRDAHTAMHEAKVAGGARVVCFDEAMRTRAVRRLQLENDLRRALEGDQFFLHYQPVVGLADGRVVGVEALLRWKHPREGVVGPGEFIALAEETGQVVAIGYAVVERATRQAAAWIEGGQVPPSFVVSVNLSVRQLEQADLAARLFDIVEASGLAPERIEFEITETWLAGRPEVAARVLHQLKAMGFRLGIDDFGTGYASFDYVRRFPVDRLKIDRTFLGPGTQSRTVVESIVRLARQRRLEVVAEGIETAEQAAWLRDVGCELGQGFHFSSPQSAALVLPVAGPARTGDREPRAGDGAR